jgi:hypothetical protein
MNETPNTILEPTIANPFATPANKSAARAGFQQQTPKKALAKPVMKTKAEPEPAKAGMTTAPARTFAGPMSFEVPEETLDDYNPGFYVSVASKRFLNEEIKAGKITRDEIPFLFEISMLACNIFGRPAPSLSDVELAVMMRSVENLTNIVKGTAILDVTSRMTMQPMSTKDRRTFWQKVAEAVLEKYEEKHPGSTKIASPQPAPEPSVNELLNG